MTIDEILALPDVEERVDALPRARAKVAGPDRAAAPRSTATSSSLDLRDEEMIHAGNRFMIYALFPEVQHLDPRDVGAEEAEHRVRDRQVDPRPGLADEHRRADARATAAAATTPPAPARSRTSAPPARCSKSSAGSRNSRRNSRPWRRLHPVLRLRSRSRCATADLAYPRAGRKDRCTAGRLGPYAPPSIGQTSARASCPCSSSHARRAAASPLPISMVNCVSVSGLDRAVADLQQPPRGRIERRLPQLLGRHLAQALEPRDLQLPSRRPSLRSLSSAWISSPSSRQ